MPRASLLTSVILAIAVQALSAQQPPPPVLDMHIHALGPNRALSVCIPIDPFPAWDPAEPWARTQAAMATGASCSDPWVSPSSPEAAIRETLEVMERRNVYGMATGSPERVAAWVDAAPDRFLSGVLLWIEREGLETPPDSLRALHQSGRLDVLGEVANQYSGVAPGDEAMTPYWDLAQELDLPVGIHIGIGAPGVRYLGSADFRADLSGALTLEEVLVRYPGLRIYVMHAGFPMLGQMLALMWNHPQVHVDVGAWIAFLPRPAAERYLRHIVEMGFSKRIMFGSDAQQFPQGIERGIDIIEEASFLTEEQKRDILYNNAARFLRLDEDTIRRHHAGG